MKPFKWVSKIIPVEWYEKIRRIRLGVKLGYDYERFKKASPCCSGSFVSKCLEDRHEYISSMDELKAGMDEESIAIVDKNTKFIVDFVQRFPALNALYPVDYYEEYYMKDAVVQLENKEYSAKLRGKYKIKEGLFLEEYIFECGYGVEFLDRKVVDKLKDTVFIDCGANWGDSVLVINEYSPKKVYAFEPVNDTYATLKEVVADNGLTDIVVPVKKGVGDSESIVRFYKKRSDPCDPGICVSSNGSDSVDDSQYPADKYELQEVQVVKIDDVVRNDKLNVGLIKMDIEGAEIGALNGAVETIRQFKPLLIISIYHCYGDYIGIKPLIEDLGLGYKFKVRKMCKGRGILDTILIAYVD